jgi:MFS family permease
VLINVGGWTMVLDLSVPATRGRLSGLYNAWIWTGYALAPLLGGFLVDSITFRPAMLVLAGCTSLGLLVAIWRLPETCPPARRSLPAGGTTGRLAQLWNDARSLLVTQPAIRRGLILFAMVQFAGDGIVLSSLSLLASQRLGSSVALGPWVLGIASFSGGLLALRSVLAGLTGPAAGHLSDRRFSRPRVIAAGLGLGALSFATLSLIPGMPGLVTGVIIGAVAGGTLSTVLSAYIGDMAPPGQQGATLGAYATFGDAGSMAGPVLTLSLTPLIGLPPVYLFAAAIFLAGAVWVTRK